MPATYEKIATTTLGSAASTITFSSISSTFTDLRLVLTFATAGGGFAPRVQFNNDTGTNYSQTRLRGDGSSASSSRVTSNNYLTPYATTALSGPQLVTMDIFSYAGSTYKTSLLTSIADNNGSGNVAYFVGLWSSTSAINEIDLTLSTGTFDTGTTATLYGILKA